MTNIVVAIWLGFASSPILCSPAWFRQPERPNARTFFVAQPGNDSIYVGDYFRGPHGVTKVRPDDYSRPKPVYGQIATVTKVQNGTGPSLKVGSKIVLIWWGYGASCHTTFPYKANLAQPGRKLFLSLDPRPRTEWINGLPTYDAKTILRGRNDMWVPALQDSVLRVFGEDSVRVDLMSGDEYFEMHRNFPVRKGSPTTWRGRLTAFLKWSERNRSLMRKYPGCSIVATTRVNADPTFGQPLPLSRACDSGRAF
jgi:hypothetical protein